ncbi:MAG: hypothetical protein NWQ17_06310 [Polaribacter sp.]|nr:hypothetical protein [Polaribacter sp.]
MKNLLIFCVLLSMISCSGKKQENQHQQNVKIVKQSEMAALMLKMYEVNLENKSLILQGKQPQDFSKEFLKIHSATLTDPSDRNASFEGFSEFYLDTYQQLMTSSKDSLITNHNKTINSCIACHKTTCIGPIPRIKKLLISSN